MIEIEKNFELTEGSLDLIKKHFTYLGEVTNQDAYYDKAELKYFLKDIWLRERNGSFELKARVGDTSISNFQKYSETNDEKEIIRTLGLDETLSLRENLKQEKILPIFSFKTSRQKFRKNEINLEVDYVIYDDYELGMVGVEVLIENEDETESALASIQQVVEEFQLQSPVFKDKVKSYFKLKKPAYYQALAEAKAI
jgi:adenylate cyclase class IV